MLIFEGPDCVGKTTACLNILKFLPPRYTYQHLGKLPAEFDRYWGYVDLFGKYVVQDRFHLSELAYAGVNGLKPFDRHNYSLIDSYLHSRGAFVVLITASRSILHERYREGEQIFSLEEVYRVNDLFESIACGDVDYPTIDGHFYCDRSHPYVTAMDLAATAQEYLYRVQALEGIKKRCSLDGQVECLPSFP
jgi:thymidylate kinase